MTCRFLTGFSQVFVAIFLPVWSDRRAPNEQAKQCWLTGLLIASTVGVLLGYIITAMFIAYGEWYYSFYFQALVIIPIEICFMVTPPHYLDISDDNYEEPGDDISSPTKSNTDYAKNSVKSPMSANGAKDEKNFKGKI